MQQTQLLERAFSDAFGKLPYIFSEVKHFLTIELKDVLTGPITDDDVKKLMDETDK